MRIVSLVPSLTQTVSEAGLKSDIVGITSFCVDPPDLHRRAARVGGTKDPDIATIRGLRPTHILVNAEENRPADIVACQEIAPTLITFPKAPGDVPAMLRAMAEFLSDSPMARQMIVWAESLDSSLAAFSGTRVSGAAGAKPRFIYLIWRNPWMACGTDSYISRSLELFGLANAVTGEARYPAVSVDEVAALDPDTILFSSEPYPFRRRDQQSLIEAWPGAAGKSSFWIDGKIMSWYGSETLRLVSLLKERWPPLSGGHVKDWSVSVGPR